MSSHFVNQEYRNLYTFQCNKAPSFFNWVNDDHQRQHLSFRWHVEKAAFLPTWLNTSTVRRKVLFLLYQPAHSSAVSLFHLSASHSPQLFPDLHWGSSCLSILCLSHLTHCKSHICHACVFLLDFCNHPKGTPHPRICFHVLCSCSRGTGYGLHCNCVLLMVRMHSLLHVLCSCNKCTDQRFHKANMPCTWVSSDVQVAASASYSIEWTSQGGHRSCLFL